MSNPSISAHASANGGEGNDRTGNVSTTAAAAAAAAERRTTSSRSNTNATATTAATSTAAGTKQKQRNKQQQQQKQKYNANKKEVSHYVVTAHPPGTVLLTCKCNFITPYSMDVLIAKPRRIEVRQLQQTTHHQQQLLQQQQQQTPLPQQEPVSGSTMDADDGGLMNPTTTMFPSSVDTLPIVLQLNNVNGNLIAMEPLRSLRFSSSLSSSSAPTTPIFLLQERLRYAVVQYDVHATPYPIRTLASGSLAAGSSTDPTGMMSTSTSGGGTGSTATTTHIHSIAHLLGRTAETGPIVTVDPECRCIVLHLYDGLLTILPINPSYVLPTTTSTTAATAANRKSDNNPAGSSSGSRKHHEVNYYHNMNQQQHQSSILGEPFHCRIEERTILALTFLSHKKNNNNNMASASTTQPQTSSSQHNTMPLLCLLHQDSRGTQHVTSHAVNLRKKQLHLYHSQSAPANTPWLKKSAVDGGSAILISVPPPPPPLPIAASAAAATSTASASANANTVTKKQQPGAVGTSLSTPLQPPQQQQQMMMNDHGGILVLGQRQFTYVSPGISSNSTKIVPVPQAMYLTYDKLPDDPLTGSPRYLIGDEFGNLHLLSIVFAQSSSVNNSNSAGGGGAGTGTGGNGNGVFPPRVIALQLETLGSCTVSSSIAYLDNGLCFVGSAMGDSQLIQIHDEPITIMPSGGRIATTATAPAATSTDGSGEQEQDTTMMMNLEDEYDPNANTKLLSTSSSSDVPEDVLVDLMDTTYISVVEEYLNLGPILDFDLVPTAPGSTSNSNHGGVSTPVGTGNSTNTSSTAGIDLDNNNANEHGIDPNTKMIAAPVVNSQQHYHVPQLNPHLYQQSQVVTASGTSKSGTIRLIRNGIGMNEYASVDMAGIQAMWSIRKSFHDYYDTYLVQSFVGETRVLGVTTPTTGTGTGSGIGIGIGTNDEELMMIQNDDQGNNNDDIGIVDDEVGGTLEEVVLPGLEPSASSLYIGNVQDGDRLLQITVSEILLIAIDDASETGGDPGRVLLDTWAGEFTVAAANEAGQIVVAMAGGQIVYLSVTNGTKISKVCDKKMDREVSCINLNPFVPLVSGSGISSNAAGSTYMDMDIDEGVKEAGHTNIEARGSFRSTMVAVGLWDDFTVRLLSLENDLDELACLNLSTNDDDEDDDDVAAPVDDVKDPATTSLSRTTATTSQRRNRNNMMARSLCLITLDYSSNVSAFSASSNATAGSNQPGGRTSHPGVNMLFVGLGDGTLLSFAVVESMGVISTHSRKEVCLGTQCINLVPLNYSFLPDQQHPQKVQQRHHGGAGTCVLATGDRPTVIYLAGVGGVYQSNVGNSQNINPKLCYSNINVASGDNEEEEGIRRPPSQQTVSVNVASPFYSPFLFGGIGSGMGSHQQYSLCVADDTSLRLGVIDDIQKLHVTTCRLGMSPRRIVHCPDGRLFAVGCIESGIKQYGLAGNFGDESNMGNCIRFMDDTTFDDLDRVDLEPFEMILSMAYVTMSVPLASTDAAVAIASVVDTSGSQSATSNCGWQRFKPFLLVGTGYALPDEDEPTRGRILIYSCQGNDDGRAGTNNSRGRVVRQVAEFSAEGGVYSITQFFDGLVLATVNSRTHVCRMIQEETQAGLLKLQYVGNGHFGHILSLFVKSRAKTPMSWNEGLIGSSMDLSPDQPVGTGATNKINSADMQEEMIAIVGDLMRSISVVQYYPQHQTLEEIARDFNVNWTTAVEMLTDSVYLGAENWNNLFCLRRNGASASEEVRCRLDTIGEYHLGEMCNKFMSGSLVMPVSSNANTSAKSSSRRGLPSTPSKRNDKFSPSSKSGSGSIAMRARRPVVVTGSQTLFGTASGTLGVVLGMDARTAAFFSTLERAMANPDIIRPIGDFFHSQYRACHAERRIHPAHGFVDGDLVESFLDLDRGSMERVVAEMNHDGSWELLEDFTPRNINSKGQGKDDNTDGIVEIEDRAELTIDYVLAMVEEMTMVH